MGNNRNAYEIFVLQDQFTNDRRQCCHSADDRTVGDLIPQQIGFLFH